MALGGLAGALVGWWLARHPDLVDPRGGADAWPLPAALAMGVGAGVVAAVSLRPDHYGLLAGLFSALFAIGLVVLAGTDFKRRVLPNRLTYSLLIFALAVSWAWPDRSVVDALVGCAVATVIAVALIALGLLASGGRNPGGAFGLGDMKLILVLGALLGWPLGVRALILGTIFGGIAALLVMVRSGRSQTIAYGPYLIAGGLLALLWPAQMG